MKPSMKMMMLANREKDGMEAAYGGAGAYRNNVENRKRYSDGRYAPQNRMNDDSPGMEMRYEQSRMRHSGGGYEVPPVHENGNGYRMNEGSRMIGFYGGEPEYRNDYRMNAGYQSKDEFSHGKSQKQGGYASSSMRGMDKRTAKEWVKQMKNSDGSSGETWNWEKIEKLMEKWKVELDPVEFYATINMLYSDYGAVAMKYGIAGAEFWVDLAKAFLEDKDAKEDKLQLYYECIVK